MHLDVYTYLKIIMEWSVFGANKQLTLKNKLDFIILWHLNPTAESTNLK